MDTLELERNLFVIRESCPCCGSKTNSALYSCKFNEDPVKQYLIDFYSVQGAIEFKYFENQEYDLRGCNNCGLVYQKTILGDFLMGKLYSNWIDPAFTEKVIEKDYDKDYYLSNTRLAYKILTEFKKKPSDLSFLDFGMGWGNWAKTVASFGVNSFGVEISEERIENAKKYGIKNLKLDDLKENSFDFINTDQVFEHISDPKSIIEKLSKSLKKGGILRICVPDGNSIHEKLKVMDWASPKGHKNSLNVVAPLEHINCFTTTSLIDLAKNSGLQWHYLNYYPALELIENKASLLNEIKIATMLPIKIIKYFGRIVKIKLGMKYTPVPTGTNLYFKKT